MGLVATGSSDLRDLAIDRMRALAVVWVIVTHAALPGLSGIEVDGMFGDLLDPVHAVGLFFALSGYLVAGSVERSFKRKGLRGLGALITRRWLRLAIPHAGAFAIFSLPAVATLISAGWNIHSPASPLETAGQLALVGAWYPVASPGGGSEIAISSMVVGNWSISAEWFAALLVIPYATLRLRSATALAIVATLLTVVTSAALTLGGSHHFIVNHIPAFLVGIWAYRIVEERRPDRIDRTIMVAGTVASAAIGLLIAGGTLIPAVELAWGMVILSVLRSRPLVAGRIGDWLAWLGARSYGAYLFHAIGISLVHAQFSSVIGGLGLWGVCAVGGLVAGVVGGALTARLLESPAISAGRRLERHLLR